MEQIGRGVSFLDFPAQPEHSVKPADDECGGEDKSHKSMPLFLVGIWKLK